MNDKIKINLQMAGAAYPLTINREDEEIVREAAKQVNIRINAYPKPQTTFSSPTERPCSTSPKTGYNE